MRRDWATKRWAGFLLLALTLCPFSAATAAERDYVKGARPFFDDDRRESKAIVPHRGYVKGALGFFKAEDATISSNNSLANAVLQAIDAKISTNPGFTFNVGVGYKILDQVRAEFEFARFTTSLDEGKSDIGSVPVQGDVRAYAFLWNAYYDFPFKGGGWGDVPVDLYIGFGVGLADLRAELNTIGGFSSGLTPGNDTVFAYNVKGGWSYKVRDWLYTDVGYRYLATETVNFGFLKGTVNVHSFEFGLRYLAF